MSLSIDLLVLPPRTDLIQKSHFVIIRLSRMSQVIHVANRTLSLLDSVYV